MRRTPYAIALEVERCLALSLSNGEFEILAEFLADSEDPEETGRNLMNSGADSVWRTIEASKKK